MGRPVRRFLIYAVALLLAAPLRAEPVPVRFAEGLVHGFLTLRDEAGQRIADGDLLQIPRGDQVTSTSRFHFHDGSFSEETVVFSQRPHFRVLSDHLVQRGPSFPTTLEASI